jgi:hypothetical protein
MSIFKEKLNFDDKSKIRRSDPALRLPGGVLAQCVSFLDWQEHMRVAALLSKSWQTAARSPLSWPQSMEIETKLLGSNLNAVFLLCAFVVCLTKRTSGSSSAIVKTASPSWT